jgi:mannose/fructose/N-acetylgalactosamine-specific phosphotransferase system component IID
MTKKKIIKKKSSLGSGIINVIKDAKYVIGGIMVVLALMASIFSFDSRYYKTAEAQQQQQQLYKSFDDFRLRGELRDLQLEQKRLYDLESSLKRDLERYPKDLRIKEYLFETQRAIEDNKKEIEDIKKQITEQKK